MSFTVYCYFWKPDHLTFFVVSLYFELTDFHHRLSFLQTRRNYTGIRVMTDDVDDDDASIIHHDQLESSGSDTELIDLKQNEEVS